MSLKRSGKFAEFEIAACSQEPVDIEFRAARFQIRDIVGARKRGKEMAGHQIDHLNGVLFIDSKLKRDRVIKKFTKAGKRAEDE